MTKYYMLLSVMPDENFRIMKNIIETTPLEIDEKAREGLCDCQTTAFANMRELKICEIVVPDYGVKSFEKKMETLFCNYPSLWRTILLNIPIIGRYFRGKKGFKIGGMSNTRNMFVVAYQKKVSKTGTFCKTCGKLFPDSWK